MNSSKKNTISRLPSKGKSHVLLLILILVSQAFFKRVSAQDSSAYSIFLPQLTSVLVPLSQSQNPSAILLLPQIEYGNLNVGYGHASGNFKPVLIEGVANSLNFSTEKFRFFKRTVIYGSFMSGKQWDAFADYSNADNPYSGNPYVMLDTVGHDDINRQYYQLKGKLVHRFGKNVVAASVDYRVSLAAQTRDPRAKILVNRINFMPGYLLQLDKLNMGVNIGVDYRNEEINVQVIQENRQDNVYYLLGLRSATTLRDHSFLRRYNRLGYQSEVQLSSSWLTIILGGEIAEENIDDGEYNWAVSRSFARLNQISTYVQSNLTFKKEKQVHAINLKAEREARRGAEIIQSKELLPDNDRETWVKIAENQSFKQNELMATLWYSYTKLRSQHLRNFSLGGKLRYATYRSEYRVLDDHMEYQNLQLNVFGFKTFPTKNGLFILEPSCIYGLNIDRKLKITDYEGNEEISLPPYYKVIENKLVRPDFNYFTSGYLIPSLQVTYERKINKSSNKMYLQGAFECMLSENISANVRNKVSVTLGFTL